MKFLFFAFEKNICLLHGQVFVTSNHLTMSPFFLIRRYLQLVGKCCVFISVLKDKAFSGERQICSGLGFWLMQFIMLQIIFVF